MVLQSRRSHFQVIADILRIQGSKTAVMYGANLSYAQTQKYLDMLVTHGLVRTVVTANGRSYRYERTPKGQQLLDMVESLELFVDDISPKAEREAVGVA